MIPDNPKSPSRLTRVILLIGAMICCAVVVRAQRDVRDDDPSQTHNYAPRIVMVPGSARTIAAQGEVTTLIVLDPRIVKVELGNHNSEIIFKGLAEGQTTVILCRRDQRQVYVVEVKGQKTPDATKVAARAARLAQARDRGSYSFTFSPGFGPGQSVARQAFEVERRISPSRSIRIEGNLFNFIGHGSPNLRFSSDPAFGFDRLSVVLNSQDSRLEILDTNISLSPLTLNGYSIRGVHLVSSAASRFHGIEFFGGQAQPFGQLVSAKQGYLAGFMMPMVEGKHWRVRSGVVAVASRNGVDRGGLIFQVDGRYEPSDRFRAKAELTSSSGSFSWRARVDLQSGPFTLYAEQFRLDKRSPLIGMGVQSGGRRGESVRLAWQPSARLHGSVSYTHAASELSGSKGGSLENSNLFGDVSFNVTRRSRLALRFTRQQIDSLAPGMSSGQRVQRSDFALTHEMTLGTGWANNAEGSLTLGRQRSAGLPLDRGFTFRDELRHSWRQWTATTYISHTSSKLSLASLLLGNPALLPPNLRASFDADPLRFIFLNRDALSSLLGGIDLPSTGSTDVGIRTEGRFSRYTLSGDLRYTASETTARRRDVLASFGLGVRLDDANSVQLSASRLFAIGGSPLAAVMTFSYTHRFGAGIDGFQFSSFLGLSHGRIEGRVFMDTNSNGRDDRGEPGVKNVTIQLDDGRRVLTDGQGRFHFTSIKADEHRVSVVSNELGVRVRATTPTEQEVQVAPRSTSQVSFGLTDVGSIAGRIFNDLGHNPIEVVPNPPGIRGVSLRLRRDGERDAVSTVTVDASGMYEFRNLTPGSYIVEIDPMTIPPDFILPTSVSWHVIVEPLKAFYLDVPIAAERVIFGTVFRDLDHDGKFDPKKDELMVGARVFAGEMTARSDDHGSYILRHLPAGKIEVSIVLRSGEKRALATLQLEASPDLRRVNLPVADGIVASNNH
jgi:hypothetical protein